MISTEALLDEIKKDIVTILDDHRRLLRDNAELRDVAGSLYRHFYGVVHENWSYMEQDFELYESRLKELSVETEVEV